MAKTSITLQAFNRGLVSPLGLARKDLPRTSLSAETQTNWMPRTLGSMMLRPGLGYLGSTKGNAPVRYLPFVFSAADTALLELTDLSLRVWISDTLLTRPSITTTLTNGGFTSDLSGWTSGDEAGATSSWSSGALSLVGTGANRAIRTQTVTVSGANVSVEHALRVTVTKGRVLFKVGSTSGGDEHIRQTTLYPGEHSLAFTPGGNFYVWIAAETQYASLVDSCLLESSGAVSVTTPWLAADLQSVRAEESADVLFVACRGHQQRRIERRNTRSWSVVKYEVDDGPFRVQNFTAITLTPTALTGAITITASKSIFKPTHVGAVWRLTSKGQSVTASLAGDGQFTNTIKVVGVGARRVVSVTVSGTWSGTIKRQRSFDSDAGPWEDVDNYTTANVVNTFNDGLDNSIVWYRLGFVTGGYSSGTAVVGMSYAAGSINGSVRITGYTSGTQVSADVLSDLGALTASEDWAEGDWSDFRGWPSAVALHDGRLWWAGKSKIWGTVSDAFNSLDDLIEGDSGTISRSIGSGPVDSINWLLSASRLFIGGDATERTVQASSFDETLTPTNFGMRETSTLGSANVPAVRLDGGGFFVQRGGVRVFGLNYDESTARATAKDATSLVPEVGLPSIVRVAVQRLPDTRVHCVRSDGKVAVLIYDEAESVNCWVLVETTGTVEDVVVLPGAAEDQVYYVVNRTISAGTVRYLERWALESEAVGGAVTKLSDAFYVYSGASTATISGLAHLNGLTVCVWAGGVDLGTFVVASNAVTLPSAVTSAVIGIPYTAQFKSTKLGEVAQRNRISKVGVLLANTHAQGIQYGIDFDTLDNLPLTEGYTDVVANSVWSAYGEDMFEFNGTWAADMRLCLQATSPRPCTVLGAVMAVEEHAS